MTDEEFLAQLSERLNGSFDAANHARIDMNIAKQALLDIERYCLQANDTGEIYQLAARALNELGVSDPDA